MSRWLLVVVAVVVAVVVGGGGVDSAGFIAIVVVYSLSLAMWLPLLSRQPQGPMARILLWSLLLLMMVGAGSSPRLSLVAHSSSRCDAADTTDRLHTRRVFWWATMWQLPVVRLTRSPPKRLALQLARRLILLASMLKNIGLGGCFLHL